MKFEIVPGGVAEEKHRDQHCESCYRNEDCGSRKQVRQARFTGVFFTSYGHRLAGKG